MKFVDVTFSVYIVCEYLSSDLILFVWFLVLVCISNLLHLYSSKVYACNSLRPIM